MTSARAKRQREEVERFRNYLNTMGAQARHDARRRRADERVAHAGGRQRGRLLEDEHSCAGGAGTR
ncbi:MAG: hypothetical protein M3473_07930 [Chloroflexota bacterium]|nr:hypothetical protein [Chloroflexota bacterium]